MLFLPGEKGYQFPFWIYAFVYTKALSVPWNAKRKWRQRGFKMSWAMGPPRTAAEER